MCKKIKKKEFINIFGLVIFTKKSFYKKYIPYSNCGSLKLLAIYLELFHENAMFYMNKKTNKKDFLEYLKLTKKFYETLNEIVEKDLKELGVIRDV